MLMVGMPNSGAAKDTLINDIKDRNLGGVILFAYNLENPDQIRSLTGELQDVYRWLIQDGYSDPIMTGHLFNTNIYNEMSLTSYVVSLVTSKIADGSIEESTIDAAYNRIMALKDNRVFASTGHDEKSVMKPGTIQISNYPNPFNPATTISVSRTTSDEVNILITNSLGQVVQNIYNGYLQAGIHSYRFNAGSLASGVYFMHVRSGTGSRSHPMLLVN